MAGISQFWQMPNADDEDLSLAPKTPEPFARTADVQPTDPSATQPSDADMLAKFQTLMQPKESQYGKLAGYFADRAPEQIQTGLGQYNENKVSPEELRDQSKQERLYALLGQLDKSANQVGTIGGRAAQSTLGDFLKGTGAAEREELASRQRLADAGKKDAYDALGMAQKADEFGQQQALKNAGLMKTSYDVSKSMKDSQQKLDQLAADKEFWASKGYKNISPAIAEKLYEVDQKTRAEAGKAGTKKTNDQIDLEMKLADKFTNDPNVKAYYETKRAYDELTSLLNNPSKDPQKDQAIITKFAKLLDPGSVVRESEFATTAGNQGILDRLKSSLAKAEGKALIEESTKENIRKAAADLLAGVGQSYEKTKSRHVTRAKKYGADPTMIVNDDDVVQAPSFQNSGTASQTSGGEIPVWVNPNKKGK